VLREVVASRHRLSRLIGGGGAGPRGRRARRARAIDGVTMSEHVKEIAAKDYEQEVLAAAEPVVLDFYSTECPPCEALAPKFEAVAEQLAGRARFVKIFRQGNRELATRLGVTGSPTLVFYKGGREVGERMTGEDIKRSALKAQVEALLG
jgi:thiol-disulfide isomerase/thioredoxin